MHISLIDISERKRPNNYFE